MASGKLQGLAQSEREAETVCATARAFGSEALAVSADIRRLDDCGQALIIDQRYRLQEYRQLLPPWWTYHEYQIA